MAEKSYYKFPYEIKDIEPELNKKLLEDFKGERTGYVQVGPKKYFLPVKYRQCASDLYNFKPRPSDVWIVSFPRSGTTLTQEIIWLIENDLDYKRAAQTALTERFPFLEFSVIVHPDIKAEILHENRDNLEYMEIIENLTKNEWEKLILTNERRFIKTHLPLSLLPPDLLKIGCKVIYVARNPKDVVVSFYHLHRLMRNRDYNKDFCGYWNYFENNLVPWTPYWEHLKEGLDKRNEPNLLFLYYENANKDLRAYINMIASFLDKHLSENEIDSLLDHLDIKNFQKNASVNIDVYKRMGFTNKNAPSFIGEGKNSTTNDMFDSDLSLRYNNWYKANSHGIDVQFPTHSCIEK